MGCRLCGRVPVSCPLMRWQHGILCAALICAGCVSKPLTPQPSNPVAGLKPATQRADYTSEQLGQLYLSNNAYGDWFLARLAAACDALAHHATTPDARYEALQLKASQGTSVYSILTGPNPIVQVLNLQALLELTHLQRVGEGKAVAVFGDGGALLVRALDEMRMRGRSHALRVISEHEVDSIGDSARTWRIANRQISDVEFIRFEDFATELAQSFARTDRTDLGASIQSAAEGLADTQLLGVRSLYFMSRVPRIVQWQLEAQVADVARRPESRTLLDAMTRITRTLEKMREHAVHFQRTLESVPHELAHEFTGASVVKEALEAANRAVQRGEDATKQLAAVEASVRRLDGSVVDLSRQLERLNQAYTPDSIQKMAQEGKLVAAQAARSLIYLIGACIAGLVVLHALLRRWSSRPRGADEAQG